jgi:LytS/YehU family sensor histidine kinase
MIVGLSEFLRRAVEDTDRPEVPLAEEVEYLQRYLAIQKVRFAERLQATIDIPAELLPAQVPALILQPLVENAIKHGIAKLARGGAVRVAVSRCNHVLHLTVDNDGPPLRAHWQNTRSGIGIANLRTRLQILYGTHFELSLHDAASGGVHVRVSVPFRET